MQSNLVGVKSFDLRRKYKKKTKSIWNEEKKRQILQESYNSGTLNDTISNKNIRRINKIAKPDNSKIFNTLPKSGNASFIIESDKEYLFYSNIDLHRNKN